MSLDTQALIDPDKLLPFTRAQCEHYWSLYRKQKQKGNMQSAEFHARNARSMEAVHSTLVKAIPMFEVSK